MVPKLSQRSRAALFATVAGLALFAPTAAASADDHQPNGPTSWGRDSYGKPYPVNGWKNCAEAQAHGVGGIAKGDPGYNPALDPTGSGMECI